MEKQSINSILKDIVEKSSFVFAGNILNVVLSMGFTFIVARFIGPQIYGRYVYIFSLLSFFAVFVRLGLDNGILYFIPKFKVEGKPDKINSFIIITILIILMSSLLITIFLIFFGAEYLANKLNNPSIFDGLRLMAPLITLMGIQAVLISIFKANNSVKEFIVSVNILKPLAQIVSVIFLSYVGLKFLGIVLSVTIGYIISIVFLIFNLKGKNVSFSFNKKYLSEYNVMILYSLPLFLNGLVGFFIDKTDILMIGYYLTDLEVGIYSLALKIGTLSAFILSAFNKLFAPRISSLFSMGKIDEIEHLYKKITNYIVVITFFCFMIILIFNKEMLMIFGKEFVVGSTVLIIIAFGQIIRVGVGSAGYINTMTGNSQYELYISSVAIFLNVGLNYLMIPTLGINGAAIASMLSNALKNLGRLYFVWRDHKIHPYSKDMAKNLVKVAILGVLIFIFKIFVFDKIFY